MSIPHKFSGGPKISVLNESLSPLNMDQFKKSEDSPVESPVIVRKPNINQSQIKQAIALDLSPNIERALAPSHVKHFTEMPASSSLPLHDSCDERGSISNQAILIYPNKLSTGILHEDLKR